ncbi:MULTISPECIES: adenylyltransferase/cytidyltransferase family protein [Giesbergeria]|uniref:Adenylyltransferase/cytidyltransferase family protein n=1 Tax=Giesbergeria sinuosa TaxID=80883 RepID=A0ABV9QA00_9BURK
MLTHSPHPPANPLPPDAPVVGGTIGAFDLLHVGHLRFLTAARQHCQYLKVGVGTDRLLRHVKGRATVCHEAHRLEVIQGLRCVDEACLFDVGLDQTTQATRWLADWGVNTLFVSSEWIDTPRWQRLRPLLAQHGLICRVLPYTQGISSTALRQKVLHP